MPRNYLKMGDWNAICDVCGWQFKASMLKKRWDGAMVCPADWESRHPQDLLRSRHEIVTTPWSRPEPDDVFINVGDMIFTEYDEIIFAETTGEVLLTET